MSARINARSPVIRRLAVVCIVAGLLSGCGSFDFLKKKAVYVEGIGRLPGGDFDTLVTLPPGVEISFPALAGAVIGPQVRGPRVLMIGDSILASTSSRYGNEMCNVMAALGWQVELEAEASRFADFGAVILDARLAASWDSALIFLGTNFDGNLNKYEKDMRGIFDRLAPMPFVVVTTPLFRDSQNEVNNVITELAAEYKNVTVLQWAEIAKNPGVQSKDRIHLSADGRSVFAAAVARTFGFAPPSKGACLPSLFVNDSGAGAGVMPSTTLDPASTETSIALDPNHSLTTSTVVDPSAALTTSTVADPNAAAPVPAAPVTTVLVTTVPVTTVLVTTVPIATTLP